MNDLGPQPLVCMDSSSLKIKNYDKINSSIKERRRTIPLLFRRLVIGGWVNHLNPLCETALKKYKHS